jgi:rfaE bifunctional protein nucleotidyltransferase chain/domain
LDFARGNVLFDKKKNVVGILDFEEAEWGEPEKDLASSLSFLVADNPRLDPDLIFDKFLKGYLDEGRRFGYDKLNEYYWQLMKKRGKEGNKKAVLLLAKRRLEDYRRQVEAKILTKKGLVEFRRKHRGKKIIFTVGAFELLHWGHLEFLKKARSRGDLLVAGVASDESRKRLKGESHPLTTDRTRAETMAHFGFIDRLVVVAEDNIVKELKILKPEVFYTINRDWQEGLRKPEEEKLIKSWGGKVVKINHLSPKIPASLMVEKIALLKVKQSIFQKTKRQPMLKFRKRVKIPKEVGFQDLGKLSNQLRRQGKTITFTSLTADLFHLGHARFIQKAKCLSDVLVTGIPSNKSVTALKGPGRPIIDERARAWVLSALDWVDRVVIFDERTILGCLQRLKPDFFFTVKDDWNTGFLSSPEAQFMKSIKGKIARSERQAPFLSASKIIDKAAGELIQRKFSHLIKIAREASSLDADSFDPHTPEVQLAARERGFYDQVLATVSKKGKCVFCDLKKKYLIEEKDGVVLTVALFPYVDGHLLIIPQRHIEQMEKLKKKEQAAVFNLVEKGKKILKQKLKVENVWFMLREGEGIKAGKTVSHLHFHLIPYSPEVIKMGEKKLATTPLKMAQRLKKK